MLRKLGGNHMDNGASSYRRFLDGDESAFDDIMKELFDKFFSMKGISTNDTNPYLMLNDFHMVG